MLAAGQRSRDVWAEIAEAAGIAVLQRGLLMSPGGRRPAPCSSNSSTTEMGARMPARRSPRDIDGLRPGPAGRRDFAGALYSARTNCASSCARRSRGSPPISPSASASRFWRETVVRAAAPPRARDQPRGHRGRDGRRLPRRRFSRRCTPERIAAYGLTRCKLHMMRLAPRRFDDALRRNHVRSRHRSAISAMPSCRAAGALARRLAAEQGEHLANGVHLIVVRSADGSLVVGDSHHYAATPDPFAPTAVDDLILDEYAACFRRRARRRSWSAGPAPTPRRRIGSMLVDRPSEALRIVLVTSGTGASISFAIAEEVVADLFG